jgi:hypothetical protein
MTQSGRICWGAFLRTGRPRGPGMALKNEGGFAPHTMNTVTEAPVFVVRDLIWDITVCVSSTHSDLIEVCPEVKPPIRMTPPAKLFSVMARHPEVFMEKIHIANDIENHSTPTLARS